jgi:hypothetical protein
VFLSRTSSSCPTGIEPNRSLSTFWGSFGAFDVTVDVRGTAPSSRAAQATPIPHNVSSAAPSTGNLFMTFSLLGFLLAAMAVPRRAAQAT